MIDISTKLKELRIKEGLSQEKLAEQLMVSRQAVSKWENGEALPDMENMVALAKLYNISLDELVGINSNNVGSDETAFQKSETVIEDGSDEKKSGFGVHIKAGDKVDVKVGDPIDDEDFCEDDDDELPEPKTGVTGFLHSLPYPIIVAVAYILLGSLAHAWHIAWILFVTIPVYYSLISCIAARRFAPFAYPVLATCIYLFIGMQYSLWHPGWVIFLTIPIYHSVAYAIDKAITNRKKPDSEN
jgi:transcriptional regulator with XRE-family HTH domain